MAEAVKTTLRIVLFSRSLKSVEFVLRHESRLSSG